MCGSCHPFVPFLASIIFFPQQSLNNLVLPQMQGPFARTVCSMIMNSQSSIDTEGASDPGLFFINC